jgi:hypothetical protein
MRVTLLLRLVGLTSLLVALPLPVYVFLFNSVRRLLCRYPVYASGPTEAVPQLLCRYFQ